MKRLCSLSLSLLLVLSLCLPAAAAESAAAPALPKARDYPGFADVPAGAWYEPAVKLCYEAGVLNGTSDTAFSPQDSLTAAQLEVLTARVHWRLQGNEGEVPAAPAGTGRVSITRSNGTAYDAAGFAMAGAKGLKDGALPKGDYLLTLGGHYEDEGFPYMTIQVDGVKTYRATLDRRNSYDPLFYMFRYHISEAEYGPYDPMVRINTYSRSDGACVDAWYWGADQYLRSLEGAMEAALPVCLVEEATRFDAAAVMSLIAPEAMLPALRQDAPPDTDRADVLRLYQAGVITGTDEAGTFNGQGTLTRAQFAVLLARLLDPALRVSSPAGAEPAQPSYTLEKLPESYQTARKGAARSDSWSDLTGILESGEAGGAAAYLFSSGDPVLELDDGFPGRVYLSGVLAAPPGKAAEGGGASGPMVAVPYVDGVAPAYFADSAVYGYCAETGGVVIPPAFLQAGALVNGVAIVQCPDGDFYRLTVNE